MPAYRFSHRAYRAAMPAQSCNTCVCCCHLRAHLAAQTRQNTCAAQECEAELRQQKALASQGQKLRAKEREAAAAQPLEASQRAVIRDLSLKLALMERQLAASKADRSQVQVRGRCCFASTCIVALACWRLYWDGDKLNLRWSFISVPLAFRGNTWRLGDDASTLAVT